MSISRVLVVLIFAAFLADCTAHIPVYETQDNAPALDDTQDNVAAKTAQSGRAPLPKAVSQAKKRKPETPESAAAASTTTQEIKSSTVPNVGSPQKWEKERAEEELKEQHLKQVIEGICRGC